MKTPRNPITILRTLRNITLPHASKERMRAELSAYADLHALTDVRTRLPIRSPFSSFVLPARSLYAGALTLVLMIAGGTQASLAAEDAVPGDILYPIKVAVSEPLSFILASSNEGKAELAARFASRRVDEAATLSSVGKLDEKTADELAARFDSHVDVLAKETETLEAKGEISASLAVRTDLEQKLSERVEEFVVQEISEDNVTEPVNDMESEDTADRFSARVFEKSKTLATTRERLESALALDIEAELKEGTDLAAIRTPEPYAGAQLFFAKAVSKEAASTTATSTAATSTEEEGDLPSVIEPAGSRFFMPFMSR